MVADICQANPAFSLKVLYACKTILDAYKPFLYVYKTILYTNKIILYAYKGFVHVQNGLICLYAYKRLDMLTKGLYAYKIVLYMHKTCKEKINHSMFWLVFVY